MSVNSPSQHPPNVENNNIPSPEVSLSDIRRFENGVSSTNFAAATPITGEKNKFAFKILEINITDQITGEPVTAYTIGQYTIFPDGHTRVTTYTTNALYQVRSGKAVFWIADEGKTIPIGNFICIPKGVKHSIYNKGDGVDVKVDLYFPGKMTFPTQRRS